MPHADADGVKLYYEECGDGPPVIFVHEFAGDHRSWEPQMRAFSRRYRCIAYNARGYPPSDVPDDLGAYSQEVVADDIGHVLSHLGIERAHVVGLSMGGFATLHFGLRHPDRARSLVVAGCGYGAEKGGRAQFIADAETVATIYDRQGSGAAAENYAVAAARVQFQNKNRRGWAEFKQNLAAHSAAGAAATLRGYQKTRPSLYDLEDRLRGLHVPTLIAAGDEDEPCLEPGLFLKRSIPSAGLSVLPQCGHTINLEEPDVFNRLVLDFLATVDAGRWGERDPRSLGSTMLGATKT
ncbi:MAG: alpha/beta hydrolase [Alphaproteobacteria bacterium]|jgi:pimeloyl-ACP methyl ester carboxylesterase|nr:alpha/beta hydrolase [Alphaproteobacteria bacterium]MDP6517649.1 alpha/beta hydrolase [Alphaproteobacteria bacterium]